MARPPATGARPGRTTAGGGGAGTGAAGAWALGAGATGTVAGGAARAMPPPVATAAPWGAPRRVPRHQRGQPARQAAGPAGPPAGAAAPAPAVSGPWSSRALTPALRSAARRTEGGSSTSWSWFGTIMPPGDFRPDLHRPGIGLDQRDRLRPHARDAPADRAGQRERTEQTARHRQHAPVGTGIFRARAPGWNRNVAHRISSTGVTPITRRPERITVAVAATSASLARVASGSSPRMKRRVVSSRPLFQST